MALQRICFGALWASLTTAGLVRAHAIDIYGNQLEARSQTTEQCSPAYTVTKTEREICTVTVREIVAVGEHVTITQKEGQTITVTAAEGQTLTVTKTEGVTAVIPTGTTTTHSTAIITPSSNLTYSLSSRSTTRTISNTTSTLPSSSTISVIVNSTSSLTSSSTISTTASTTSSPTSTATSCPVPPSCDNLGFNWAYYSNPAHNGDTTYSTFHPDTFKTTRPSYIGITRYVGGLYGPTGTEVPAGPIYDSTVDLNYDYFALNHHAYLYACQAGTYHISIPYANDAVYLWIGAKAYAGWTDNNADAKALYDQPDHIAGHATYTFTIPAATYVPIRFFYGQAQYGGGFDFTITTPSGQVIVSNTQASSPYVVQYSCDRISAPRFPAFGSEL